MTEFAHDWWESRRLVYNIALVGAVVLGYLAYLLVIDHYAKVIKTPIVDAQGRFIAYDSDRGIFACCGGLVAIIVANLFFFLGALVERFVPSHRVEHYRTWTWRAGLALSCFLPFSIAVFHLISVWFFPNTYHNTPYVVGSPANAP